MARTRWSPILDGTLRAHALAAVADTVAQVRRQRGGRPTLALGLSGLALLLLEATRVQPRLAAPRDVDRMVARLLPEVEARPLLPSLYEGYSGVGLTLELVRRAGIARVDGIDAIDRALLGSVERFAEIPPEHASLDIISGLAGQALYACARMPRVRARRALEAIVGWLDRRAILADRGATWLSPPRPAPTEDQLPGCVFDLGVAHGVPGILAALARVHQAGVAVGATRRLLEAGTRWLLRRAHTGERAAWDSYVPSEPAHDPGPAMPAVSSRPGWCYGDPGVAVALLNVAHALGDRALHATAMALVRRSANDRDDPRVIGAGLCHGASGLLHMFNRVYQATGDASARDAALHWAERTLHLHGTPAAIGGPPPPQLPYFALHFLGGAAGSALALLAAACPTAPSWDAIMLLDLPVGRG